MFFTKQRIVLFWVILFGIWQIFPSQIMNLDERPNLDKNNLNDDLHLKNQPKAASFSWNNTPVLVSEGLLNNTQMPIIEYGKLDDFFILWDNSDEDDLYIQHFNTDGSKIWNSPIKICDYYLSCQYKTLAITQSGEIIVSWITNQIIYSSLISFSGQFLWNQTTIEICNVSSGIRSNLKTILINESLFMVWGDTRGGYSDIYAQKINITTGESLWLANGTIVCPYASMKFSFDIEYDGVSGIIIIWEDLRFDENGIYMQRLDSNGNQMWTLEGLHLTNITGRNWFQKIRMIGSEFLILWFNEYNNTVSLYRQKIAINGTKFWGVNGTLISIFAAKSTLNFKICTDNESGLYCLFELQNEDFTETCYVNRITIVGNQNFLRNLGALGSSGKYEITHFMDGFIISYFIMNSTTDIYIKVFSKYGNEIFTTNKKEINQGTPSNQILATSNGTTLISWTDNYRGKYELYMKKITMRPTSKSIQSFSGNYTLAIKSKVNCTLINTIYPGLAGDYRVHVMDEYGDSFLWLNWTPWYNNTNFEIPIYVQIAGKFTYIIEFRNMNHMYGVNLTTTVKLEDVTYTNFQELLDDFEQITNESISLENELNQIKNQTNDLQNNLTNMANESISRQNELDSLQNSLETLSTRNRLLIYVIICISILVLIQSFSLNKQSKQLKKLEIQIIEKLGVKNIKSESDK